MDMKFGDVLMEVGRLYIQNQTLRIDLERMEKAYNVLLAEKQTAEISGESDRSSANDDGPT